MKNYIARNACVSLTICVRMNSHVYLIYVVICIMIGINIVIDTNFVPFGARLCAPLTFRA